MTDTDYSEHALILAGELISALHERQKALQVAVDAVPKDNKFDKLMDWELQFGKLRTK